jgi:hypothetical protein
VFEMPTEEHEVKNEGIHEGTNGTVSRAAERKAMIDPSNRFPDALLSATGASPLDRPWARNIAGAV